MEVWSKTSSLYSPETYHDIYVVVINQYKQITLSF